MDIIFFGQAIGIVALGIQFLGFLKKGDKTFFLFLSISSFFWAIHYFMLGLLPGSLVNLGDVIKNYFGFKGLKTKVIFYFLLALYTAIGVFCFFHHSPDPNHNPFVDYASILAAYVSIYAIFFSRGENLRLYYVVIMLLWLIYSVVGGSIAGTIVNSVLLLELFYAYYTIHSQRRKYKREVKKILLNK